MTQGWSRQEIDLIVADYFAMLIDDLAGARYSKADHNRSLQQLIARSKGAIEFKHQNISAVLLGLGQPWIPGYKPAANFQNALVDGVVHWLEQHPEWWKPAVVHTIMRADAVAPSKGTPALIIGPPPAHRNEPPVLDPLFAEALAKKYDVAERDARNRALGKAGEELVLRSEIAGLKRARREDLADKVRWTSVQDGDGYGFDVFSFEPDGRERLIEVKTTNGWERTPFHISSNELAVAEQRRETWCLLRVWDFARGPKAFELRPPLEAHAQLSATAYRAALR